MQVPETGHDLPYGIEQGVWTEGRLVTLPQRAQRLPQLLHQGPVEPHRDVSVSLLTAKSTHNKMQYISQILQDERNATTDKTRYRLKLGNMWT